MVSRSDLGSQRPDGAPTAQKLAHDLPGLVSRWSSSAEAGEPGAAAALDGLLELAAELGVVD